MEEMDGGDKRKPLKGARGGWEGQINMYGPTFPTQWELSITSCNFRRIAALLLADF